MMLTYLLEGERIICIATNGDVLRRILLELAGEQAAEGGSWN